MTDIPKIKAKDTTIYEWTCPVNGCNRTIRSLYKKQLEYNIQAHLLAHELSDTDDINNIAEYIKGGEK